MRALAETPAPLLNATLSAREDVEDELCFLRVRYDGAQPQFKPGQFVRLGLIDPNAEANRQPALVRRAYSIASSPSERSGLEFYLVKVPDGELTPQVWQLRVGDRLWADVKIQGEFTLDNVPQGADILMVATGTGIAPFISMLRTFAGTGRWRSCTVVHGARRLHGLGYAGEVRGMAARHPDIRYVPIVSREPAESAWPGLRGRVLQIFDETRYAGLTGAPLDPEHTHVFLCGNPDMMQEARTLLTPLGFALSTRRHPGHLHVERFW